MNDGLKWTRKVVAIASSKVLPHLLGPRTRKLFLYDPRCEFWNS